MIKPEEVSKHLLSFDYVIENSVDYDDLYDEYYTDEKGVYHYERMFDKPMDEGGKPFSGLSIEYISGEYAGYTEYKDGYQCGDEVFYYPSGTLRWYKRLCENEYYIYTWYESGILKEVIENHRKDDPRFRRSKEYDENGRLIKQEIQCEFNFTYDFDSPPLNYEVTWHENGEFKLIRNTAPTREIFYPEMEFDENGYPVREVVNPHYSPEFLSPEKYVKSWHTKTFDEDYCFNGEILMYRSENNWYKYSGTLCFRRNDGTIEKIMDFKEGLPYTGQRLYYPNGNLKEDYCVAGGKEYYRHLYWYENGCMQMAVLYSCDKKQKHIIRFDEKGNVIG